MDPATEIIYTMLERKMNMKCPYKEADSTQCYACQDEKSMPYVYCCLVECGEHEFCRGCDKGVYLSTK